MGAGRNCRHSQKPAASRLRNHEDDQAEDPPPHQGDVGQPAQGERDDRGIARVHGGGAGDPADARVQGCTAFGKVFFVRHFREPIPLQTTAMDQVTSVMGSDENIVEGLTAVCGKHKPDLVGLPTTGLAETQGADIRGAVRLFRNRHPEFNSVTVVPVNTPDYAGCFESGYASAVRELIEVAVPESRSTRPAIPRRSGRVAVLASSMLSVGDVEAIKDLIEAFGLQPVVLPDLADSLDGHLTEGDFNPLTYGGISVAEIGALGTADAAVVIGRSLGPAADLFHERTGVPVYRFDHLLGFEAMDAFVYALHKISGRPVPQRIEHTAPSFRTRWWIRTS